MNRKASRILSLFLSLCLILSMGMVTSMAEATDSDKVEILFMDTGDVHGLYYPTNYSSGEEQSGTYSQGMTRVATYIKEQRQQYSNVFLSDSGDLIQGTPLSYYYSFNRSDVEDPGAKILRLLDYDMFVLGNHEFNYGMDILQRQLGDMTAEDSGDEHQVLVSSANYLDASTNNDETKDWATWNGYEPYHIYEYDGVKVAVMGIANPNIPNWDIPANWEGIYFAGVVETYKHYEEEMKANSDMIVLISHSGIDGDPELSDFIRELVSTTDSIDLVFSGHEHRNGVTEIENANGEIVKVVSPGTKCAVIGRALVTYDKATGEVSVDAETVDMKDYPVDEELTTALQSYENDTWSSYLNVTIGQASDNFSAANLGTAPSAFLDLINQVQLWGAYDNTGLNTPDDPSDDTPAQLSISAPLISGNAENLIPAGNIKLGDLFSLYRYENWFYQLTMSGKEIRTWLECSASKLTMDENGNPTVEGFGLTYYDVIYGEGFSYVLDCSAEEGSRVVSMTYNGEEVADDAVFTIVMNNYRFTGGGDYIKYLNEHGVPFDANDESRVIYSTRYDMIQGEDLGQARSLLMTYIANHGTIDPVVTSTWSVVNGSAE